MGHNTPGPSEAAPRRGGRHFDFNIPLDLIQRVADGDSQAEEELWHIFRLMAHVFAVSICSKRKLCPDRVDDLVGEMAVVVVGTLRREPGRILRIRNWGGWLYTVMWHLADHIQRIDNRRQAVEGVSLDNRANSDDLDEAALVNLCAGPDDTLEKVSTRELAEKVEQVLSDMPEKLQADAFRLVYRDGLTYRETAERLGTTVGTVSTWIRRIRFSLFNEFERWSQARRK